MVMSLRRGALGVVVHGAKTMGGPPTSSMSSSREFFEVQFAVAFRVERRLGRFGARRHHPR